MPITLETATLTTNVAIPTLEPWRLSVYVPPMHQLQTYVGMPMTAFPTAVPCSLRSRSRSVSPIFGARSRSPRGLLRNSEPIPVVISTTANVSSKGFTNATFQVPGKTTIPSDGAFHNVTIAALRLGADMEWIAVPKQETKTHLKVRPCPCVRYALTTLCDHRRRSRTLLSIRFFLENLAFTLMVVL